MNFHVLTLFPEMIENGMNTSITGRAITKGLLTLEAVNIPDYAFNKHQRQNRFTLLMRRLQTVRQKSQELYI